HWLEQEFAGNVSYKEMVARLLTATGKNTDNGAVNFILVNRGQPVPAEWQAEQGQYEMFPITWRSSRLFLGARIDCCLCHDHPFLPQWKQGTFWKMNVFFRQFEVKGKPLPGPAPSP